MADKVPCGKELAHGFRDREEGLLLDGQVGDWSTPVYDTGPWHCGVYDFPDTPFRSRTAICTQCARVLGIVW